MTRSNTRRAFGPVSGRASTSAAAAGWASRTSRAGHEITGPDAWRAMFVTMALTMVLGRLVVLAARTTRLRRTATPAIA